MDDITKQAFSEVRKELRDRVGKKLLSVTIEQPADEEDEDEKAKLAAEKTE